MARVYFRESLFREYKNKLDENDKSWEDVIPGSKSSSYKIELRNRVTQKWRQTSSY